jgi:hypothetical protein
MYSSAFSPRRWMRMGGQRHPPAASAPAPLPGKRPGTLCTGGKFGPGLVWVRTISHPQGFDSRTVRPVASLYTDRTIPFHTDLYGGCRMFSPSVYCFLV